MKLLSLNIGIKIDNSDQVIQFLRGSNADIVALQEVTRSLDSNVDEMYNNSVVIKTALNDIYKYDFFGALWKADRWVDGGILERDFGGFIEQGNEILSKFPITDAVNKFFHKTYAYFVDVSNFRETDHGRAIVQVIVEVDQGQLQIINIHGIWNKEKSGDDRTIRQSKFIIENALEKDLPTIIVGDFNLRPDSESIKILDEKFTNLIKTFKIKTTRPKFDDGLDNGDCIDDYIFVNDKIKVNEFKVVDTDISDHFPLLLDFEIVK